MRKIFTLVFVFVLVYSVMGQEDYYMKYRNVLNIKNIPANPKDLNSFAFLDLGSWFGFALPGEENLANKGSFIGPYLATEGKWLGQSITKLCIKNASTGAEYDFSKAKVMDISFYPGTLVQRYIVDNIYVELQLIFLSNRTAAIRAGVRCMDDSAPVVTLGWTGNVFEEMAKLVPANEEISINLEKSPRKLFIHWDANQIKKIGATTKDYAIFYDNVFTLDKTNLASAYIFFSQVQNETEKIQAKAIAADFLNFPRKYYDFNRTRWNRYMNKVFQTEESWGDEAEYKQGALKCLITLINNWKSPMGALRHDGIVPSYSHNYFTGFWAWDSWKHASALAHFEPALAKNQMRAMFDFQNSKGMIPDCVFIDSTQNNWLDTKPPLAAWAVWNIFDTDKDLSFLKEFYPKLVKYHKWWYTERDHDKNGLCEYGATKDSLIAALWESGMDNAIRFDAAKLVRNNNDAYSLNMESVDLNSYLYAEKLFLAKIAAAIGLKADSSDFAVEAAALKTKIQDNFYDKKTLYFFDISLDKKKLITVYGPEGWIPLWAQAATNEQALAVHKVIYDSDKFYTRVPFPTVSADNTGIDPEGGYWRGPVWLDQAYFGIMGLKYYGFTRNARSLTERVWDRIEGYINSDKPIRENYNPLTGKGLKANHFSWSAAHLLLLWWGK